MLVALSPLLTPQHLTVVIVPHYFPFCGLIWKYDTEKKKKAMNLRHIIEVLWLETVSKDEDGRHAGQITMDVLPLHLPWEQNETTNRLSFKIWVLAQNSEVRGL